jgi:hypothetical protein
MTYNDDITAGSTAGTDLVLLLLLLASTRRPLVLVQYCTSSTAQYCTGSTALHALARSFYLTTSDYLARK